MATKPDWERIEAAGITPVVYHHLRLKGEAFVSGVFRALLHSTGAESLIFDGDVPPIIRIDQEFMLPGSRIDYLLTHSDGSVTVCELKDGALGKQAVLAGIGQVIGYGIQVGASRSGVRAVRKALVFSALPTREEEVIVIDACFDAGIIPVAMGSEAAHRESAYRFLEGLTNAKETAH